MDHGWRREFGERMLAFEARRPPKHGDVSASIKVRVSSGCFHREHSPNAYRDIDKAVRTVLSSTEFSFEEHESGPELLVYLALTTAGLSLTKSIIDLIVAILKARSDGIRKGDHPSDPLELIVRRTEQGNEFKEELVLRVGHGDKIDENKIAKALESSLKKLVKKTKRS